MSFKELRFLGSRIRFWSNNTAGHEIKTVVIFLHGSGFTGFGMEKWMKSAVSDPPSSMAVILPSAPMQTYSLEGGQLTSVWHQRQEIDINSSYEDIEGIDKISDGLGDLIGEVRNLNISKIILGGFSM